MRSPRDQRGVALPSPVVLLSIVAIAMAAIAYLVTEGAAPTEREVAIVAREDDPAPPGSSGSAADPSSSPSSSPAGERRTRAPVQRAEVVVDVYNNSGVAGLAGQAGGAVVAAGWQVATTDNWYGSVPATTVYYPAGMKRAGRQLALDLGVQRTLPVVGSMNSERLTIILTAPLA